MKKILKPLGTRFSSENDILLGVGCTRGKKVMFSDSFWDPLISLRMIFIAKVKKKIYWIRIQW